MSRQKAVHHSNTGRDRWAVPVKWGIVGAVAGAAAGSLFATAVSGLASYFARQIVTPARERAEVIEILAVVPSPEPTHGGAGPQDASHGRHSAATAAVGWDIILPARAETTVPGTYSLFFDSGRGHARIGGIVSFAPADGTVTRHVERVYEGDLLTAVRGRWSGVIYPTPQAMGYAYDDVEVPVQGGVSQSWLVAGAHRRDTWAIMVHGRGSNRLETIRGLPVAHQLGMTSLLLSYRNDGFAPEAEDQRYGLGSTEWQDVDAAIEYALAGGAREIVLFGWSMGGAICLQTVDKSRHAHQISALVLDGPVVDWIDVLAHQARINRIPESVGRLGQWLIGHRAGRLVTGLAAPVDLKELNWVDRADHLRTPTLILHSEDDDFVPIGPSAALAELNPGLVTFERFTRARHTHEWNVDPQRWDDTVRTWLGARLDAPAPGHHGGG
ncbi:alpha/beta hydrolase family protein [Zhihengliuella salsuginis]|uniref:Alpha/beta hydrolase n=1 Tax=Zhihengliuella salsuginis TaxID=578222 RepID=A0ABQ3GDM6_9MICC|nr:alpha/beta fold hydrolase [Zhihengliuella salsuginis]GHD01315.1 alpha/beta hydrolase [Zhihengliuella salsuginis]